MKKVLISLIVVALTFGMAGLAEATPTISFLSADSFAGVDPDTSGWSTSTTPVNLGVSSLSLLGGMASVDGYENGSTETFGQRGIRGLGIWGGGDNDEVDTVQLTERIEITFPTLDYYVNSLEVRSLFDEPAGTEQGVVDFYLDGSSFYTESLVAVQTTGGNGVLAISYATPKLVDKLVFYVPTGQSYTGFSELAVASLDVTPIPESASLILWSLLGGTGIIMAGWRQRKRKAA